MTADHSLSDTPTAPTVAAEGQFNFDLPMHVFEKASAPEGKKRRFGGICSTDSTDRQGERILQDGLDWGDFFEHGWFNDNHSQKTADVLGYGDKDSLLQFKAGDILPNGTLATNNGTWVEGYLLDRPACDQIWDLAQSLQGTGRNLGFSVEGNIVKRTGPANKTIAKAKIRNIAVTNCPVNTQAKLEILARSLLAVEQQAAEEEAVKAMGGAGPAVPLADAVGTGMTAGRIVATEALEGDLHDNAGGNRKRRKRKKKNVRKSLTHAQAVAYLQARAPGLSKSTAEEIMTLSKAGEGSRGGRILGHTKSGKAVYAHQSASSKRYSNFTQKDHDEAGAMHHEQSYKHHEHALNDGADGHHLDAHHQHAKIGDAHYDKATVKKSLDSARAISYLQARAPGLSKSTAHRILRASKGLELAGLI